MLSALSRRVAVASVGAAVSVFAARRAQRRRAAQFYDSEETARPPAGSGVVVTLPAAAHRAEGFAGVFPADLEAVTDALPTGLHAVRFTGGRGLLLIQATRFHETTAQHVDGPTLVFHAYAEVTIGVLATKRPAPPVLPLIPLVPASLAAGVFPLLMPVTSREARDGGLVMGLPKFVADLDFDDDVLMRRVTVSENDEELLALTVDVDGAMAPTAERQSFFHVLDGELLETRARLYSYIRRRVGNGLGRLELGRHTLANELRRLGVADAPIATQVVSAGRGLMPAPGRIGRAGARPRYAGADVEFGRYTVRYPHTDPIDQYARTGMESTAAAAGVRLPGQAITDGVDRTEEKRERASVS